MLQNIKERIFDCQGISLNEKEIPRFQGSKGPIWAEGDFRAIVWTLRGIFKVGRVLLFPIDQFLLVCNDFEHILSVVAYVNYLIIWGNNKNSFYLFIKTFEKSFDAKEADKLSKRFGISSRDEGDTLKTSHKLMMDKMINYSCIEKYRAVKYRLHL